MLFHNLFKLLLIKGVKMNKVLSENEKEMTIYPTHMIQYLT